ncbi:MAG TPA: CT253 family lipoprotein [Chlamydiales bacterium]|jgi:hypothetical protein|nr:CT253 family lipoprotein [Chlamydiales bacterium]
MRSKFCLLLLSVLAVSCGRSNEEISRFHDDGRAKPVVAVASAIDTTSFECPWSLSEEITTTVTAQIAQTGKIFVHSNSEFPFVENPFGNDLSWVKREFQNEEFVLFLELVEHENKPVLKGKREPANYSPQEVSTNLNMSIRIRVLDIRGAYPKIVLQEMVRDAYYIPKTLIPTDYNTIVWGSDEYRKSPMGIAHAQFIQEIASRVTDYVLLAKSR